MFTDDLAMMGCMKNGQEEYRELIQATSTAGSHQRGTVWRWYTGKLDWAANTDALGRKVRSRLASFICRKLLQTFY